MTAPNQELLPLIHRHLKEHGFLSAAEELQKKLTQQNEAPTATLLDIYTAWSKSAKRRKKAATSKKSTPDGKQSTTKKAAGKKTNKTNKQSESPNKEAKPTSRKKDGGKKTAKVVKTNKSGALKKEAPVNEDSDSSLDEEKWKKLVREMTDTDLLKVEAFNALVAPEPKKRSVRKPRAKPKPKTETPIDGQGSQNAKLGTATEEVGANSNPVKKSRVKKAAPVALNSSNIKTQDHHVAPPEASVVSTPKLNPKKGKRKVSGETLLESKPKKKKVSIDNNVSTSVTDENGKNVDDRKGPEKSPSLQTEPKKKKKKQTADGNSDKNIKDINVNNQTQTELKEGNPENDTTLQTEVKKKTKKKVKEVANDSNVSGINNSVNIIQNLNSTLPPEDPGSSLNTSNTEADSIVKVNKKKKSKEVANDSNVLGINNPVNTIQNLNGNLPPEDPTSSLNTSNTEADLVVKVKKKKKLKEANDGNVLTINSPVNIIEDLNSNLPPEDPTSSLNNSYTEADSVVKVKKKKKRKDNAKDDDECELAVEAKTNSVISVDICEKTEESNPNNAEVVHKKKKKKKDKNKEEAETSQQTETNVIDEEVHAEENTEEIVAKKKSKKRKKQSEEHSSTEDKTLLTEGCEIPSVSPDQPSSALTPGSKKKKLMLTSEKLVEDAAPPTLEGETPKKKKKKTSSKSKDTEN